MNELLEMANRLNGYDKENYYEIIKAEKNGNEWILTVKRHAEQEEEGAENESNK